MNSRATFERLLIVPSDCSLRKKMNDKHTLFAFGVILVMNDCGFGNFVFFVTPFMNNFLYVLQFENQVVYCGYFR